MVAAKKKAAPTRQGASKTPYERRLDLYERIERERRSRVLCYVTGDRRNLETQLHSEVVKLFVPLLDGMFPIKNKKLTLILYTKGGDTLSAWSLVNTIRMYCDELEIIVPSIALSAGTLMCLGANRIVMTKQAMLGPIDPSITGPLNPVIPGAPNARAPVSVEAVRGYIELAKSDFGVTDLTPVLLDLANKVHPLVLGAIFRTKSQIQTLAREFLEHSVTDKTKQQRIIDFLCSESGSHDYTINRREAHKLGLVVEKCSQSLYVLLDAWLRLVTEELQLDQPFDFNAILAGQPTASYDCVRALIEGTVGRGYTFSSRGTLTRVQLPAGPGMPLQDGVNDQRSFEGWSQR